MGVEGKVGVVGQGGEWREVAWRRKVGLYEVVGCGVVGCSEVQLVLYEVVVWRGMMW